MIRLPITRKPGPRSATPGPHPSARRGPRSRFRAWAERLEDRTVMATLNLVANQLSYTAGPGIANLLTISTQGPAGNYFISDAIESIVLNQAALDAGWSNILPNVVTGPDASVTSMTIGLLDLGNNINIQSIGCDTTIQTVSALDTYSFTGAGIRAGATVSVVPSFLTPAFSAATFDFGNLPGTVSFDDTGTVSRYQVDGHGAVVDYSGGLAAGNPNVSLLNIPDGGLTLGVNTLGTSPSPVAVSTMISTASPGFTQVTASNTSGQYFASTYPTALLNRIVVGGTTANDTVIVDYSAGDPLPANGLTFDGGPGGFDTLTLQGTGITFNDETIDATGPGAGTINYAYFDGEGFQGNTIHFSNLAPINDLVPSATLNINTPLAAENVDVFPGPTIGPFQTTVVSGPGAPFELVNFANKTAFNLFTTGNNGTVRVDTSIPAVGLATVNIYSQSGKSDVVYLASNLSASYSLDASVSPPTISDGTITTRVIGVSGLKIAGTVSSLALAITGTAGNDDYVVTETSAIGGDLAVTLNGLPVSATNFGVYSLGGGGAGIDSARVVGSNGPETVGYNDGTVTLTSLAVGVGADIPNVFIDMPGGPSNHLGFATGLSGSLYRALVGNPQDAAAFQIYTNSAATTLLKTVRVTGVETVSFPQGQELEVWGTASTNHFYMSDLIPYVRANSGPYLQYTSFSTVGLFGGGFAGDRLDYEADLTGAGSYTFTPGYHPQLVTPSTTISIDGIESMGIYGPGAAGVLTIAAIPPLESQGTAVDYTATVTGPGQGNLAAAFNQATTFDLFAQGFGQYNLGGSTTGVSSLAVTGPALGGTGTYSVATSILNVGGLLLDLSTSNIGVATIDLQGDDATNFTLISTGALDRFQFREGEGLNDADLDILLGIALTPARSFGFRGVRTINFANVGASDTLELAGTLDSTSFTMNDATNLARAGSGSFISFGGFSNVLLTGGGTAADRLDFAGSQNSYTFTPGSSSTLVTPTKTITLAGIETVAINGPGTAAALAINPAPVGSTGVDYTATSTGPNLGILTASFHQPDVSNLSAQGFRVYTLAGSTAGTSSLVVNGPVIAATTTYSGAAVMVNGLIVNIDNNIQALTVNLQGTPGNTLSVAATTGTQLFRVRENDAQYNASLEIFTDSSASTRARTLQLVGVQTVDFTGVGTGNSLEVVGNAGGNTFSMSDATGLVRASNGSFIRFTPFSAVKLQGAFGSDDRLDYIANQATAYTLTGGSSPTLLVALPGNTVVVSIAGIESMGMTGPGSAGILRVLAGTGQGAAVNYQVAVTGPSLGSLDAAFNQPSLYTFHAEGFGNYALGGSGSGVNTASVQGTWGNDTASYNGTTLVVNGLQVVADPTTVPRLWLDMLGGNDGIALSGAGATDAFSIAPTTSGTVVGPLIATIGSLRPLRMDSVETIVVVPTGSGNALNVTGDANDNAISMNDQTVRFGQGPNINFAGIGSVVLYGAGGVDSLTYNGSNASYSLDPRTFTQGILATTGLTTTFNNVSAFHFVGSPSVPANFLLMEAPTATVTIQLQYPPASGYLSTMMQAMTITAGGVRNFTLVPSTGDNVVNIQGTAGNDSVSSSGSIVTINGVGVDLGAGTTRLNVNTYGGDDAIILPLTLDGLTVHVNSGDQNDNVSMVGATVRAVLETGKGFSAIRGGDGATTILAGGGLNSIYVGGGSTLVMGRDGQNTIFGGTGRSLIITGKNYAKVQRGTGGKFVVVGTTSYDNFLPALDRVLAEWSSSASYKVRVRHILNGTGSILGGVQLQVGRTVNLSNRKSRVVGVTGVDKILAGTTDKVGWVAPTVTPAKAFVPAARDRNPGKKAGR